MTEQTSFYDKSGPARSDDAAGEDLKTKAEHLAGDVSEAAKAKAEDWREKADQETRSRTETAGERLDRVSRSIDRSADDLRGQEEWAADALHAAASQLSNLANSMKGKSLTSLASDARGLAHNNPGLFYGACAAAGLALGRFATASATQKKDQASAQQGAAPSASPASDPSMNQAEVPYGNR